MLCAPFRAAEALAGLPGAGAAGGIAFGLMAAAGATFCPGFDFVASWLDLDRRLAAADVVLTGEGRFDDSSLSGKGPGTVAQRALALGKAVHVFAGERRPLQGDARPHRARHRPRPAWRSAEAMAQAPALLLAVGAPGGRRLMKRLDRDPAHTADMSPMPRSPERIAPARPRRRGPLAGFDRLQRDPAPGPHRRPPAARLRPPRRPSAVPDPAHPVMLGDRRPAGGGLRGRQGQVDRAPDPSGRSEHARREHNRGPAARAGRPPCRALRGRARAQRRVPQRRRTIPTTSTRGPGSMVRSLYNGVRVVQADHGPSSRASTRWSSTSRTSAPGATRSSSAMKVCMEGCFENGVEVIVLDRPNPARRAQGRRTAARPEVGGELCRRVPCSLRPRADDRRARAGWRRRLPDVLGDPRRDAGGREAGRGPDARLAQEHALARHRAAWVPDVSVHPRFLGRGGLPDDGPRGPRGAGSGTASAPPTLSGASPTTGCGSDPGKGHATRCEIPGDRPPAGERARPEDGQARTRPIRRDHGLGPLEADRAERLTC